MSSLYLIGNAVSITTFGHMQFVFDSDGTFGNGDEIELEVQSPNAFGIGDWDVRPVQAMVIGGDSARVQLAIDDATATWDLLVQARNAFAAEPIAYEPGIFGTEGQNSNTYIVTLAHIADIDISGAISTILNAGVVTSFPGAGRNVLFDQIDGDGFNIHPFDLTLTGTAAGEVIQGGAGWDTLDGARGDDILAGYGGKDRLFGGAGWDDLYGDAGRDLLKGGAGADFLLGGSGGDRLSGGKGNDIMNGNGGRDTFLFNGLVNEGHDTIRGFQLGLDRLRVSGLTLADVEITGTTDATVTLDGRTEITLNGIAAADLLPEDFLFV